MLEPLPRWESPSVNATSPWGPRHVRPHRSVSRITDLSLSPVRTLVKHVFQITFRTLAAGCGKLCLECLENWGSSLPFQCRKPRATSGVPRGVRGVPNRSRGRWGVAGWQAETRGLCVDPAGDGGLLTPRGSSASLVPVPGTSARWEHQCFVPLAGCSSMFPCLSGCLGASPGTVPLWDWSA